MTFFESPPHHGGFGELYGEGCVGAVVAKLRAAGDVDAVVGDVLGAQFGASRRLQIVGGLEDAGQRGGLQRCLHGLFAHGGRVGEPDAEGGQHARHGRDEHGTDAERVGDHARVLTARTTEGGEGVAGDVVALLDGDPLHRARDVGDGDLEEALRDLLRRAVVAGLLVDLACQGDEAVPYEGVVEGLVAVGPEHLGEVGGLDAAEHHVGVGDGERAAAAVAGRPGAAPPSPVPHGSGSRRNAGRIRRPRPRCGCPASGPAAARRRSVW